MIANVYRCASIHGVTESDTTVRLNVYRYLATYQPITHCVCMLNHARPFVTLWTVAHEAPLSMKILGQEYWSWLPFLLQGIFLTQGSKLYLLHWQAGWLPLHYLRNPVRWASLLLIPVYRQTEEICLPSIT